jgi:hypothetical protein
MKATAFGTVKLPEKLPADFFQKNPLPPPYLAWCYCNSCGKVLPVDMELAIMLCEMVRRRGNGQECDFLKIDWSKYYFLDQGCSFCAVNKSYSIVPYE